MRNITWHRTTPRYTIIYSNCPLATPINDSLSWRAVEIQGKLVNCVKQPTSRIRESCPYMPRKRRASPSIASYIFLLHSKWRYGVHIYAHVFFPRRLRNAAGCILVFGKGKTETNGTKQCSARTEGFVNFTENIHQFIQYAKACPEIYAKSQRTSLPDAPS